MAPSTLILILSDMKERYSMHLIRLVFSLLFCCISSIYASEIDHLHIDWLDVKVNPSENFYGYANGAWKKQNPIPPEYSSWGTFRVLYEHNQKIIHQLLIDAANNKQAKPGSIEQKVGDFYYSGMDESTINKAGISPINPLLDTIAAIKNFNDLQDVIAKLQLMGVGVCF